MSSSISKSQRDHSSASNTPIHTFRRAYQACVNCRKRKVKCILPAYKPAEQQPSCIRCTRERKDCTFNAERRAQPTAEANATSPPETPRSAEGQAVRRQYGVNSPVEEPTSFDHHSEPACRYGLDTIQSNTSRSATRYVAAETETRSESVSYQQNVMDGLVYTAPSNRQESQSSQLQTAELGGSATVARALDQNSSLTCSSSEEVVEKWCSTRHPLSNPCQTILSVWETCRFVKLGWFTAQEAVTYVDLFFQNMSSLSPILSNYYSEHLNHRSLITREPILCCTIITISSRYHLLTGEGGLSRGFYIHDSMWKYCQSLFHQVVWGQRRAVKDYKTTLGTIESFLLVTEWHPRLINRSIHADNPDLEVIGSIDDLETGTVPNKWLQEVEELTQKSDRMSWMLLGSALTLAHEINLFDDSNDGHIESITEIGSDTYSGYMRLRRGRLKKLLFVYISQLASRIGCSIPKTPFHTAVFSSLSDARSPQDYRWHDQMNSWIELTRLVRSSSEFLFPAKAVTKELLRSGRYSEFLEHFRPLLEQWLEKHSLNLTSEVHGKFQLIDYQFVRIYINSLALQAVAGRMTKDQNFGVGSQFEKQSQDFGFIREVIGGCKQILEMVIMLSNDGHLKYAPMRIYIRIASAAVCLINALVLGVHRQELDEALQLLDRSIQALSSDTVDDLHLGVRFSSLLRSRTKGLRQRFVRVSNPVISAPYASYDPDEPVQAIGHPNNSNHMESGDIRAASQPLDPRLSQWPLAAGNSGPVSIEDPSWPLVGDPYGQDRLSEGAGGLNMSAEDWFALPFDLSDPMFGSGIMQTLFGFDADSYSFL